MAYKVDLEVDNLEADEMDPELEKEAKFVINRKMEGEFEDSEEEKEAEEKAEKKELEEPPKKNSAFHEVMSWVIPFVIAFAVVFILKTFVIINANIPSGSMENTIMTGDNLIGYRLAYLKKDPERGDIIIFNAPDEPDTKFIKRIIGLPGETVTIEDSVIYIDGEPLEEDYLKEEWVVMNDGLEYTVPDDCYFVLGDNRNHSEDARYWTNTYVERDEILGKAIFVYWPINTFRVLE